MPSIGRKTTIIGIVLNTFLFIMKFIVGILTSSLIVISDAINSLTDIMASIAIYFSVRISEKKADADHPFGHRKAEIIAGLMVAIFTGIVGFEVIKNGVMEYFTPTTLKLGYLAMAAIIITLIIKSGMYFYFKDISIKINSPAIKATSVDAKNDVFISIIALIGITTQEYFRIFYVDNIIAIILGAYIIYSGYTLGSENISFLMGKSPDKEKIEEIKNTALKIKGIKGINDVRAHYFGNYVHVEIHIEVDRNINTEKSHALGKKVQNSIESLDYVDRAFIHIDPK